MFPILTAALEEEEEETNMASRKLSPLSKFRSLDPSRRRANHTPVKPRCLFIGIIMVLVALEAAQLTPAYSMTKPELQKMANKTRKLSYDDRNYDYNDDNDDQEGEEGEKQMASSNNLPTFVPVNSLPSIEETWTNMMKEANNSKLANVSLSPTNLSIVTALVSTRKSPQQGLSLGESQIAAVQSPWLPVDQMVASDSKKKKMMKKKKKMEKKHKEWKKGKKHKKKKYESKKKKGGMEKKKKGE